jgi:hypothetical protein
VNAISFRASSAWSHLRVPVLCLRFTWCQDSDVCEVLDTAIHWWPYIPGRACPSSLSYHIQEKSLAPFNQDLLGQCSLLWLAASGLKEGGAVWREPEHQLFPPLGSCLQVPCVHKKGFCAHWWHLSPTLSPVISWRLVPVSHQPLSSVSILLLDLNSTVF